MTFDKVVYVSQTARPWLEYSIFALEPIIDVRYALQHSLLLVCTSSRAPGTSIQPSSARISPFPPVEADKTYTMWYLAPLDLYAQRDAATPPSTTTAAPLKPSSFQGRIPSTRLVTGCPLMLVVS